VQPFSRRRFLTTRYYERRAGSVGRPVPGVEVRLIDVPDKDIRVAEGGQGEVIVRGPNLFQGYWQSEDATSEARLDGWLRTGDLGRIDANGDIWLTGRSKYIIVLDSGEKVYPDEVEDKLRESDLLQDICIVSRPSSDGRERTLVTVVVYPALEASRALGIAGDVVALQQGVGAEVERLCRELAAYKRVTRVELSDSPLPKTPLLKVARGQIAAAYEFDFDRWLASENPD
jgi:long-chain acyl-CoA synthetase